MHRLLSMMTRETKLSRGTIYCAYTKQKIVTSSPTEVELVGVADSLVLAVYGRTGMYCRSCLCLPRQLKRNNPGDKRNEMYRQRDKACTHQIFLCHRQSQGQ